MITQTTLFILELLTTANISWSCIPAVSSHKKGSKASEQRHCQADIQSDQGHQRHVVPVREPREKCTEQDHSGQEGIELRPKSLRELRVLQCSDPVQVPAAKPAEQELRFGCTNQNSSRNGKPRPWLIRIQRDCFRKKGCALR